jgi:hypothetical protein
MKTSARQERSRRRPDLTLLEARCTPSVTAVQFFGITPVPTTSGNAGPGSLQLNGVVVDSTAVASAQLAVYYQVMDSQGNLLAGGPLAVNPAVSNAVSFSTTLPQGTFTPQANGEHIRIVAIDASSLLIAGSSLMNPANAPPQNLVFAVADSGGDVISGSGTATVTETNLSDGGMAVSGNGTLTATGHNASGSTQLLASGTGLFALADHPTGAFAFALNGTDTANVSAGSTKAGVALNGLVTVNLDANHDLTVGANGAVKVSVRVAGVTVTGSSSNASVTVGVSNSGHVTFHTTGKLKLSVG